MHKIPKKKQVKNARGVWFSLIEWSRWNHYFTDINLSTWSTVHVFLHLSNWTSGSDWAIKIQYNTFAGANLSEPPCWPQECSALSMPIIIMYSCSQEQNLATNQVQIYKYAIKNIVLVQKYCLRLRLFFKWLTTMQKPHWGMANLGQGPYMPIFDVHP